MKRILYIIDKIKPAGAQKHLAEVIASLDKVQFEARLITLEELGAKRIYGISGIKGLLRLVQVMKQEKFDIVHTYLFSENILGVIAAKLAGVKVIITGRRDTGMLREGKWQHFMAYRLTNRWVDKIVCVSEAVRRVVLEKEEVVPEKVEVIYNGVDAEKIVRSQKSLPVRQAGVVHRKALGIKDDEFVVGMIANFSWIKGHKELVEAAKIVVKEVPNTKFLLIGEGPEKQRIADSVERLGLKDRIIFLGKREDIPELLSIMDVSVNASYSEGMSNTVLESMAAGVPVVATAVDGNLETVRNGETGILVPSKDPTALAGAVIKLLKDRKLAKKMGENGKLRIDQQFTSKTMLEKMEGLYKKLLDKKVAFIFSQFPCYDETFIMREMNALKAQGLNFLIYSIKKSKDKIVHDEAKGLVGIIRYLPFLSFKSIFINLYFLLRHPIRYISTFLKVCIENLGSANFFFKSMGLWPQAVGFAWRARKDRICHVHGQWATFPATYAMIIARLNNIPFSFTGHAHDIHVDTVGLAQKISAAKFVLTCTLDNKKYLLDLVERVERVKRVGELESKIIVSYHGVDLGKFSQGVASDKLQVLGKFRILSVGSLLSCKGFESLIEACKILRDKGMDFECTIAGGGPLQQKLQSLVVSCELLDKVKFTGYITQDKLIPIYKQADVFVLAMVSEIHWGIPNVLLEAMAAGVPVICTMLPSIPELIQDGKSGFIVSAKDPVGIAELLIKLNSDRKLRDQVADAGLKVIKEKFDVQKNAQVLKEIFNQGRGQPSVDKGQPPKNNRQSNMSGTVPIKKRINVLYVIWSLGLGGAERVVINLAKGLDKAKFNPMVCCLNDKGQFSDELEKEGIRVIALYKKPGLDMGIIGKLVQVMKENKIDVVNTHLWGANLWGRIAAKKAGVSVILATEHNIDVWKQWYHFTLDRWLSRSTDCIIAVAESVKEFYAGKGIASKKIKVIYNGVDRATGDEGRGTKDEGRRTRDEFGIKDDEIVLGVIGRLVEAKGHRYLFDALTQLNGAYKVKLLVVGDGPLLSSLKSIVRSRKLDEKVIFTGLRRDIPSLLEAIDILVMPSLREGLPIVALEAMSHGVPIVATNVGGTAEVVQDGKTGVLVVSQNSEALLQAIEKLLKNKDLRIAMGKDGAHRVKEFFSLDKMVTQTQELYEGCLKEKAKQ